MICFALLAPSSALAYQWPMKPFDRQHPIRGAFGDPRSLRGSVDVTFDNPLSFHSGVDIQAPDGTPVYAVHGGVVSIPNGEAVAVAWPYAGPDAAVVFGYWHVVPLVHAGDYVAKSHLLGYVRPGAGHVHLSERRFGVYVNPLRRGGLAPYADHTRPVIRGLIAYACRTNHPLPLDNVNGCIDLAVDAYDPPAMTPSAPWTDAIWAPAKISWAGLYDDAWRPFGGPAQGVDFDRLLSPAAVRDVYAPGTVQNGPNVSGDYRFWLVRGLDTTSLVGDHTITVTASDTRGNHATREFSFTVVD